MATLSTVNVKITGDTGQLVSSLTVAEKRVTAFSSKVTNLGPAASAQARGFSNLARSFTNAAGQTGVLNSEISILASSVGNVGLLATGAGIGLGALVGGLAASVASAISFETAITKVAKTANFSKEETAAFSDEILDLSRRLPVATSSLTSIAAVAGQLGIQGTANISKFVEEIAKLESTTGVGAEQLAVGLGTLIQVSGLPIDAIDNVSASLTDLGNTSNSTEAQILDFAVRLAGIGAALEVPLADILSISSSFAAAGVPVERGGTAIQNILIAIEEAAAEGGDKLALFADITGRTVSEFRQLQDTDPGIAFTEVIEGLGEINNVLPVLKALEIADDRLVASALAAANAQGGLTEPLLKNRTAAALGAATNDEFARSSETTAAKLQILKNNISATSVEIGTVFLPAVNALLDTLNTGFDGLPTKVQNFKDNMRALGDEIGIVTSKAHDLNAALNSIPGPNAVDVLAGAYDRLKGSISGAFLARAAGDIFGPAAGLAAAGLGLLDLATSDQGNGNPPPNTSAGANFGAPDLFGFEKTLRDRGNFGSTSEAKRDLNIPSGLLPKTPKGASGPEPLTVEKALTDGVISLVEALELGLSDATVVALELGAAQDKVTGEEFRRRIGLQSLAAVYPGLTGEEIQFALALAAIEENLRLTNRTAEQFRLAEAVGPELDRLQSRLQEVLGQPTRETLGLQLNKAKLEKRRLGILSSGASDDDPRLDAIDREIKGIDQLIRLRETEVDIMRIDAQLADQRTLTDQAQVTQTGLLTAAIGITSAEFVHLQGAAYLAAVALERIGGPATVAPPLSLRDALIALGSLPDQGQSLIPKLDTGGVVTKSGIAEVDKGERFFNNGYGPRGESGISNFNQTTQIYVTANTKNDAEEIARVVAERLTRQQRQSDRRGAFVTTGGGFP